MRWALLWTVLIGLVLVPFFLFEEQFTALALHLTDSDTSRTVTALGIFALLALDVFLPVPSSIVATAAGVLFGIWQGATIVWAGMMGGCLLGYVVGMHASSAAQWLIGADGLVRAEAAAQRFGDVTLVLCRPVPVLAEASVVLAGLIRTPMGRFTALTAASNLGIAVGYAAFGALSLRIDSFLVAFVGALLLPGIAFALSRLTFGRR